MNDPNQLSQERIEAYISGALDGDEREQFEQEMAKDENLSQEVKLARALQESLGNKKKNAFREMVRDVIRQEGVGVSEELTTSKVQEVKVRRLGWQKWSIAAAVVVLLGLALWQLNSRRGLSNDQLYAEYYETYPSYGVDRSETQLPKFQEAMEYYSAQQFKKSSDILVQLLNTNKNNETIQLYTGVSRLELGDLKGALTHFELIKPNSIFYDQARWYQSLILLKENKSEEAKAILVGLSSRPGKLGNQAKELLSQI